MKKVLKILGIILGVIVVVVLLGAATIHFGGIPSYEVKAPDLKVEADSAMIAEGKRIAGMLCANCHRGEDGKLSGHFMNDLVPEFGKVWVPNITHSDKAKLHGYTDGELAYLLRTGVKRDGNYAPPWMPKFPLLSDKDLHSVIAYLRSDQPELEPADVVQPAPQPSFLTKLLCRVAFKPLPYPEEPIFEPDPSDKVAWGRYLAVAKFDCYQCHSADFKTNDSFVPENSPGFMGGGNVLIDPTDGKTHIFTANITMDKETGIGNWTEEEFSKAVRFAQRPDGKILRPPMVPYAALSEAEVSAIYAWLQTIPTIHNEVERNW
jgi:mono/diheme cytochrome c family protein